MSVLYFIYRTINCPRIEGRSNYRIGYSFSCVFPLFLMVMTCNVHEYANEIISTQDPFMKELVRLFD